MTTLSLPLRRRDADTTTAPGVHRHWWVEVGFVLALYVCYELSRKAVPSDPAAAIRHAQDVMSLEGTLHIGIERSLNAWLQSHDLLAALTGYYYETFHFVVVIVTLIWLYIKRPALYRRARSVLIIASFGALLVFWFFPVAPPRLAESGLTDIVVSHNVFGSAHGQTGAGFVNIYAAVPSLHVGWAVWAAIVLMRAEPHWRFRYALWLYPAATTFVVIGTANHYVIDAVAGLGTILMSGVVTRLTLPWLWRASDWESTVRSARSLQPYPVLSTPLASMLVGVGETDAAPPLVVPSLIA